MRARQVLSDEIFSTLEKDVLLNLVVVVLASVSMSSFVKVDPRTTRDESDKEDSALVLYLDASGALYADGPGGEPVETASLEALIADRGPERIDLVEHPATTAEVLVPILAALRSYVETPIGLTCLSLESVGVELAVEGETRQ
jgi:biopolymer transport protein ExbD